MATDTPLASLIWMVLRRPGTLLLAVVFADSFAYFVSGAGTSPVAMLVYLLQMFLLYRIWRGANMVPWLLLMVIAGYEAYCVRLVMDAGAAVTHRPWVAAHLIAIGTTVSVLISGPVRGRVGPLRGLRAVE
jgi:hypothetical protein